MPPNFRRPSIRVESSTRRKHQREVIIKMGQFTNWAFLLCALTYVVDARPHNIAERQVGRTFTIGTLPRTLTCTVSATTPPTMVYTDDEAGDSYGDLYSAIVANPTSNSITSSTPASGKTIHQVMQMYTDYTLDRYEDADWLTIVTVLTNQVIADEDPTQDVFACYDSSGEAEFVNTLSWY